MVTMMWSLPSGDLQPSRGDRQVNRPLQHSSGSQSGSQPSSVHLPWELIRKCSVFGPTWDQQGRESETGGGAQHLRVNKPSRGCRYSLMFEKHRVGEAEAWRPQPSLGSKPQIHFSIIHPLHHVFWGSLLFHCCSPLCPHFYQGCYECWAQAGHHLGLSSNVTSPKRPFRTTCHSPPPHPALSSS